MPEILLFIVLGILSISAIAAFIASFTDDMPGWICAVLIALASLGWCWITYSINLPTEYVKTVDATISHSKINGRTHCHITYEDLNNNIVTDKIEYIEPLAKVKVHLPKRVYFGILYTEPRALTVKIEVIENVKIQSSKYEAEEAIEGKRATGLLNE